MRSYLGLIPRVIRAGAGPHDLGSGENRGNTFPELTSRYDAKPMSVDEDPRGQWDLAANNTEPELDMVIRNVPYVWFSHVLLFRSDNCFQDEGYDSWDVIADYVFQVTPLFPVVAGLPNPRDGRTQRLNRS